MQWANVEISTRNIRLIKQDLSPGFQAIKLSCNRLCADYFLSPASDLTQEDILKSKGFDDFGYGNVLLLLLEGWNNWTGQNSDGPWKDFGVLFLKGSLLQGVVSIVLKIEEKLRQENPKCYSNPRWLPTYQVLPYKVLSPHT